MRCNGNHFSIYIYFFVYSFRAGRPAVGMQGATFIIFPEKLLLKRHNHFTTVTVKLKLWDQTRACLTPSFPPAETFWICSLLDSLNLGPWGSCWSLLANVYPTVNTWLFGEYAHSALPSPTRATTCLRVSRHIVFLPQCAVRCIQHRD